MTKNMPVAFKAKIARDPVKDLAVKHETLTRKREELHAMHLATFAEDRRLADELATLEEELKPLVRPRYVGQPSGKYVAYHGPVTTIAAQAKWSRTVDAEAILAARPELRAVPGLFVTTLDRGMLAILIKNGTVPAELAELHTTPKQETTAVSFTRTEADTATKVARVLAPVAVRR